MKKISKETKHVCFGMQIKISSSLQYQKHNEMMIWSEQYFNVYNDSTTQATKIMNLNLIQTTVGFSGNGLLLSWK